MSDLLKIKVGGNDYLCKFSYPEPLPTGYKRVKYIELNGTGYPITATSFSQQSVLHEVQSIDTIELDIYFPNSQVITSTNKFTVWQLRNNGNLWLWNDTIDMKFQEYRQLTLSNLNILGKRISIKRSARAVKPSDRVPSGYNYVGQLTVDDVLYEYNRYSSLQSIDLYSQWGDLFLYVGQSKDYSGIAGTKIFKLTMKKYLTGNIIWDFVPCIRESDSRPGFYDIGHSYFLISRDTGVWSAGPLA